jgi:hypothetical protein
MTKTGVYGSILYPCFRKKSLPGELSPQARVIVPLAA